MDKHKRKYAVAYKFDLLSVVFDILSASVAAGFAEFTAPPQRLK